MHLSQLDPQQADRFRSPHSLFYDLPDGRTLLMLSGLVDVDLQSPGWTNESAEVPPYQHELQIDLQLPAGFLAAGQLFSIEQSLPSVGLASLSGVANVFWGIQQVSLAVNEPIDQIVRLLLDLEVARTGETLKGVSYAITLLGRRC
jgi:hypothetical protein